jgi:hypothetical protein
VVLAGEVIALSVLWTGHGIFDRLGKPIGTDFAMFWSASRTLRSAGAAVLYSSSAFFNAPQELLGVRPQDLFPSFIYPPAALLVYYPLSFLPYLPSLFAWLATGMAAYLGAMFRIAGGSRLTLLVALAFPAVFVVVGHGHSSFLSAGLLGWALALLPQRPWRAGILFGLLAFKPHLAMLVPIALVAGREWRALAGAALSAAGSTLLALLAFGVDAWTAFLHALPRGRDQLELGLVDYYKLQSAFGAVQNLGGSVPLAYTVQAAILIVAAIAVAAAWRRRDASLRAVALVLGTLLATPYLLDYDLLLLAVAGAFAARNGWRPWERSLAVLAAFLCIAGRPLAMVSHLCLMPAVLAVALWISTRPPAATAR